MFTCPFSTAFKRLATALRCRCRKAASSFSKAGEGLPNFARYWAPPGKAIQSLPGKATPAFAVVGCRWLLRVTYVAPGAVLAAVERPVINSCLVVAGLRNNMELFVGAP